MLATKCATSLKNNRKVLAYPPQAGYVRTGIIEIVRERSLAVDGD